MSPYDDLAATERALEAECTPARFVAYVRAARRYYASSDAMLWCLDDALSKVKEIPMAEGDTPSRMKPLTFGRLTAVPILNGLENVYALGSRDILAVMDGDVVLCADAYSIDHEEGTIQLVRQPAFELKLLVS